MHQYNNFHQVNKQKKHYIKLFLIISWLRGGGSHFQIIACYNFVVMEENKISNVTAFYFVYFYWILSTLAIKIKSRSTHSLFALWLLEHRFYNRAIVKVSNKNSGGWKEVNEEAKWNDVLLFSFPFILPPFAIIFCCLKWLKGNPSDYSML